MLGPAPVVDSYTRCRWFQSRSVLRGRGICSQSYRDSSASIDWPDNLPCTVRHSGRLESTDRRNVPLHRDTDRVERNPRHTCTFPSVRESRGRSELALSGRNRPEGGVSSLPLPSHIPRESDTMSFVHLDTRRHRSYHRTIHPLRSSLPDASAKTYRADRRTVKAHPDRPSRWRQQVSC